MVNHRIGQWSTLALMGLLLAGIVAWQMQLRSTATQLLMPLAAARQDISPLLPGDAAFVSPISPSIGSRPSDAPPFCTFTDKTESETAITQSMLESFAFSKPTIVLTNTAGIDIAEWLPNNQQLLIARSHPDMLEQSIETLDIQTSSLQLYAFQKNAGRRPSWSTRAQSVIYSDWAFIDQKQGAVRWDLWISSGSPESAVKTVEGLTAMSVIGVDPAGTLIRAAASEESLLQLPDIASRYFQEIVIRFSPATLLYPKYNFDVPSAHRPLMFSASKQPNDGALVALYADPYLYLLDEQTGAICEVDLGRVGELPRWPYIVQWSSDGRRLAMITTANAPGSLVSFNEVFVLDVETGKLQQLPAQGYVQEIEWAADSRHILMQVLLDPSTIPPVQRLFLLDTVSGDQRKVLPDFPVGGGTGTNLQMAWSPDGARIAVKCPLWPTGMGIIEDRICMIAVEVKS